MNTTLQKKIMRRIYTAYVMRLVGGTRARHAMIMALSVFALVRFVSVVNVATNFSHVTVGQAGNFILSAFTHTEGWTLLILALFAYAAVSFVKGESFNSRSSASFA